MRNEIEKKIRELFEEKYILFTSINEIDNDDKLEDIGLDSVGVIQLVIDIEEMFGFEYGDDNLIPENFSTINNIVSCIEKLMPSQK